MEVTAGVHKKGTVSLSELIGSVRTKRDFWKAGAIGIFIGVVRGESLSGEKVEKLELEAYEEKADEVLKEICRDLKSREGVVEVQIHHLIGEFNVGEDLVYVIVAGAHRQDVFSSLKEAVERYKKEAPIFKKEHTIDEKCKRRAFWVAEDK